VGHRVSGVDNEIEQDLAEAVRIDFNACVSTAENHFEKNRVAHKAPQHGFVITQEVIDANNAWLADLFSAEGQELLSKPGGAFSRAVNFSGHVAQSPVSIQFLFDDAGVSIHHGEYVVEVVRDASGEPAYGFHFLRVAELVFEGTAIGNVMEENNKAQDPPISV
jgi:hypothetical protein